MRPFNKKRFWLIVAFLAFIEVLICYIVLQWKYIFPSNEVSEIYTHYAENESIDVSFIKGYRVNDTVFVDVTLLEAADSIGWNTLWHDFCLPDLTPEMKRVIENKKDRVFTRTTKKNSYCETVDETTPECDIIAVLFAKRTICVFHIANLEERHAVLYFNYDKSSNNNINLP